MTAHSESPAADDDETIRSGRRSEDDTVVSPRYAAPPGATSASGPALGPTAVALPEDSDATIVRGASRRRSAAPPADTARGRDAVVPDAGALRDPRAPRAAEPIRATRGPRPAAPSGGAPVSGGDVDRAVRARAGRRLMIAVVGGAALVCAAAAALVLLLI